MKRQPKNIETTNIIWNARLGVFYCEKCAKLMHYNFGFEQCPYCKRKVAHNDKRW